MKLNEAVKLLALGGVEDPRREARTIFSHYLGVSMAQLVGGDYEADDKRVDYAVKRRAGREPLQYILGEVYFYREKYKVNEGCLIPREDTEILVDYAVKHIPRGESFIDLCTGSGCVAVSVLRNTDSTRAVAVDISEAALRIAEKNARLMDVAERVTFVCADVKLPPVSEAQYFALLSNPPYVTDDEYLHLEKELYSEPRIAFVGGSDGGDFYRSIIPNYKEKIKDGGFMAFEIGRAQASLLCEIAHGCGMSCRILKDLSGNDRVAVLEKI